MTQTELRTRILECIIDVDDLEAVMPSALDVINQHVAEVIGRDDEIIDYQPTDNVYLIVNRVRAKQRKRAGL